jgi:glycosyltransferase involved in cell wall biosynthesis
VTRRVHFLVPEWIDDPGRVSGGNVYDRRVAAELRSLGWDVVEVHTADDVPDGAVLLADALLACRSAEWGDRLRLVVLAHMPFPGCAAIRAAAAVVTTSRWTRDRLIAEYDLPARRVVVAEPGVDTADPADGSPTGEHLLCVGALEPHKGQDVLLDALDLLPDVPWRCTLVGPLDRDPVFVAALRDRTGPRVELAGVRTGAALDQAYAAAAAVVVASRNEAYGMVATEALAHGLPVIATAVGGVPEALGTTDSGALPGLLVPPEDPDALAAALRFWLTDADLRRTLRLRALDRRDTLPDWAATAGRIATVLSRHAEPERDGT